MYICPMKRTNRARIAIFKKPFFIPMFFIGKNFKDLFSLDARINSLTVKNDSIIRIAGLINCHK